MYLVWMMTWIMSDPRHHLMYQSTFYNPSSF